MSHSNLPELYKEPTFGNLVTCHQSHEQNSSLLVRAKAACDPVVSTLPTDLKALTTEQLEEWDTKLNGLQSKLSDGEKISLERRKPFTQYMDKIKSEFTGIEAGFKDLFTKFKATRDNIARERIARQKEETDRQAKEIAKKQEEVMYKTHLFQNYNAGFLNLLSDTITRMIDTFNKKSATDLPAYIETISKWSPSFTKNTFIFKPASFPFTYLNSEDSTIINEAVINELEPQLKVKFEGDLLKERDRLIELKDSRIKELNESDKVAIDVRLKKEADERADLLEKQLLQQKQQSDIQAENDLLNATFEVAANGSDPIALTKNTTTKKKYNPTTHAAWAAIMQHWIHADMATMSVDELGTKLKFMLTCANKKLNEGVTIEAKGLIVEDDVSTRTTKAK